MAVPQLAKHMDRVVSVCPNLLRHPPAGWVEVERATGNPLTERPLGSIRHDAAEGSETPRITKACEDERRIRPEVSIVVP